MTETPGIPIQIWHAIKADDVADVRRLFGENPEEIDGYTFFGGGTYLHYAASHGSVRMIEAMLEIGFALDKPGRLDGELPLNTACGYGRLALARYLLDRGSAMDVSLSARNPLIACISGYANQAEVPDEDFFAIAELLLARGIDASVSYNSRTMVDMDATAFAIMWGRRDIATLIASHLHGDDQVGIEAALAEAEVVAVGNATSRTKFRRERYPPKPRKSKVG